MVNLQSLSDAELLGRLSQLVRAERHAVADVIEHLVEVERRQLYGTASLYSYCMKRLGYSEDAALKRHRVARLALRLPQVLSALYRLGFQRAEAVAALARVSSEPGLSFEQLLRKSLALLVPAAA